MTYQLSPRVLWFLTHLQANNSKVWMDERRDFYHDSKQEVLEFAQWLLTELIKINPDLTDVDLKKCLFRINRDMRFVKDGSWPYKPRFSIYIAPWGKKSPYAWLYLHIEPGGRSMIGGWCYDLDRDNLTAVREQLIVYDQEFEIILSDTKFRNTFGQLQGKQRTSLPRWYIADAPGSRWLMQDSRYVGKSYTDEQVTSPDFLSQIVSDYQILKPFNDYFNEVIDRNRLEVKG